MAPRLNRILAVLVATVSSVCGLGVATPASAQSGLDSPGAKGAQVYCFMRANGNNHEVSWTAAYALIKRQNGSLFKTSPEHAAVMITEAVVQSPGTFPECGRFLGDLYSRRFQESSGTGSTPPPGSAGASGMTRSDRYGN
ncbi:MAG: DUF6554 family protein [Cyanobium sp.]